MKARFPFSASMVVLCLVKIFCFSGYVTAFNQRHAGVARNGVKTRVVKFASISTLPSESAIAAIVTCPLVNLNAKSGVPGASMVSLSTSSPSSLPTTMVATASAPFLQQMKKWVASHGIQGLSLASSLNIFNLASSYAPSLSGLLVCLIYQVHFNRIFRTIHTLQSFVHARLHWKPPADWKASPLAFLASRGWLLGVVLWFNYAVVLTSIVMCRMGLIQQSAAIEGRVRSLLSAVSYSLYAARILDEAKSLFFVPRLFSSVSILSRRRRQQYVVDRSLSVVLWLLEALLLCDLLSKFLRIPLANTLAFGGVTGLVMGLSARDIGANFLGGLTLLFNEPFTPGDTISLKVKGVSSGSANEVLVGKVEDIGWVQTRLRSTDTRLTYIPNSQFVSAAVTNLDRRTHHIFEATVPLQPTKNLTDVNLVVDRIRQKLVDEIGPMLDTEKPYRVSLSMFSGTSLTVDILAFFATESADEFVTLRQRGNLAVLQAVHDAGLELAVPSTVFISGDAPASPANSVSTKR